MLYVELLSIWLSIVGFVWIPNNDLSIYLKGLFCVVLAAMGIRAFQRNRRSHLLTASPRWNSSQTLGTTTLATLAVVSLLLASAWAGNVLEWEANFLLFDKPKVRLSNWVFQIIVSVVFQQVVLNFILFPLCLEITRHLIRAVLLGSVLFATAHLPNPILVGATFIASILWLGLFEKGRRIGPLILSHLILALSLRYFLPAYLHNNLRVGKDAVPGVRRMVWIFQNDMIPKIAHYSSLRYYHEQGGQSIPFANALYRDILGRTEHKDIVDVWAEETSLQSRTGIVLGFLLSHEYIQKNGLPAL